ncbi:PREDICTED: cancer-associated gene 1 protein homolog [Tinamus guttatus]|uniref:cancer-associated gene 1 protein homolog n=1 Tax=Tinamus guttatus TaxID=94827 RepID=UPI00052E8B74|nr:PREDICTED: cancer-associated gene 1 protein homolog [Tinamus guttatus]
MKSIEITRQLINEMKSFQDQVTEIEKLKNHLELKEEECKRLTGENGKLHEDLRSMTLKVVSYEKITACPDERLESAQIPQ